MAQQSSIEWTDLTWNPVAGCTIESAGCTNCYAMRMAARLEAMGVPKYKGLTRKSGGRAVWTGLVRCDDKVLMAPLRWRQPRKVFVNSMSDLFHPEVPEEFIARVWDVMRRAPVHQFQILTKRPARMAEVLSRVSPIPLPNVWLGTSVEGPAVASRIDRLREAPAAIRFISFEPLLESIPGLDLQGIDWAIVGGESGPRARPMEEIWVEEIHAASMAAGTAFFFKQWGGTNKKRAGRELSGRTYDEMPACISA